MRHASKRIPLWLPGLVGQGASVAPPERERKARAARLSLATPQRLQRKHKLPGLPPQQMFVATEAIQRESR